MAVSKVLSSSSLVIEIENGVNKAGAPIYRKKAFAGINSNASPDKIYAVADAIKGVIKKETRNSYLNDTSLLYNDGQ